MKVDKHFFKNTEELKLLLKAKTQKRDQAQGKVYNYNREIKEIETELSKR